MSKMDGIDSPRNPLQMPVKGWLHLYKKKNIRASSPLSCLNDISFSGATFSSRFSFKIKNGIEVKSLFHQRFSVFVVPYI